MNLSLDPEMTKLLSDGVVLLDSLGQPRQANAAAQPWLRRCIQLTPKWSRQLVLEREGALKLPAAVDISIASDADETPPANVHLLKNGNKGYALLIQPLPGSRRSLLNTRKSGFLSLLGGEVRKEINRFSKLLGEFNHSATQHAALGRQAAWIDTVLAEVSQLAELNERDDVFADERLALADLVRALLPDLPRASGDNAVRYALSGAGKDLAPVYGHDKWLRQALRTLLGRLGRGCPAQGRVAIDMRQLGDFIVLNASATADAAGAYGRPADAVATLPGDELRAEICRRIIALHGGDLKIRFMQGKAEDEKNEAGRVIDSITLTLPTGLPVDERSHVSCAECRVARQSMQYARDLAEVMAGRPVVADRPA